MRIPLILSLAILAACTSTSSNPPKDAGGTDAGSTSACGTPGMTGNEKGVGKYCELIGDCTGETICSAIVNDPNEPERDTFVCVLPCDPCSDPVGFCGNGASCVCNDVLGGCGCFPNSCSEFAAKFTVAHVCRDAGPADAGATDAGDLDAGATDAGDVDAGETDAG